MLALMTPCDWQNLYSANASMKLELNESQPVADVHTQSCGRKKATFFVINLHRVRGLDGPAFSKKFADHALYSKWKEQKNDCEVLAAAKGRAAAELLPVFRTLQGALDIVSQGNIKCAMDAEIEAAGRRGAAPSSAAPNKSIHETKQKHTWWDTHTTRALDDRSLDEFAPVQVAHFDAAIAKGSRGRDNKILPLEQMPGPLQQLGGAVQEFVRNRKYLLYIKCGAYSANVNGDTYGERTRSWTKCARADKGRSQVVPGLLLVAHR